MAVGFNEVSASRLIVFRHRTRVVLSTTGVYDKRNTITIMQRKNTNPGQTRCRPCGRPARPNETKVYQSRRASRVDRNCTVTYTVHKLITNRGIRRPRQVVCRLRAIECMPCGEDDGLSKARRQRSESFPALPGDDVVRQTVLA